jgi:hypothetical protein
MVCSTCRQLEAELDRLESVHAEKLQVVEAVHWQPDPQGEYRVLQSAESDARLALEIMRARLNRHKREEHGAH